MFLSIFLLLFSFFMIVFNSFSYTLFLLFLEIMMLGILLGFVWSFLGGMGLVSFFMFLVCVVCMGSFGISLLVSNSRFFGSLKPFVYIF